MARMTWDGTGERFYETGVDRGVLYLADGSGVPWCGLVGVEMSSDDVTATPLYLDGVKYYDDRSPGDFKAVVRALTYPIEFEQFLGSADAGGGWLLASEQPVYSRFGMSYRTMIGNDTEGLDMGYRIHLLYNLTVVPDTKNFETLTETPTPTEFQWDIGGVPKEMPGFKPSAHFEIDSRKVDPLLLAQIEERLYGSELFAPRLPNPDELQDLHLITITDNGDGTWTADGPEELIIMETPTQFRIDSVDATYLDADTYEVSTTQ